MEIIIILTVVSVIAAYLIFSKKKAVRPSLKKMSQEQKEKNLATENAEKIDKAMRQEAMNVRKSALASLSSKEVQCLEQARALLYTLSPAEDALGRRTREKHITDLFFQTRAIVEVRYGDEVCRTNYGDELSADAKFLKPRLADGLSVEDIRSYWNQPLLMALLIPEIHLLAKTLYKESLSKDQKIGTIDAERMFRKSNVFYGNPVQDVKQTLKIRGYAENDAALFIEFYTRINQWQLTLDPLSKPKVFSHSEASLNAVIRNLIAAGQI